MSSASAQTPAVRIVSLNLWAGKALGPLLAFVQEQAPRTDVFCFQEALDAPEARTLECGFFTALYSTLQKALPEFDGEFHPMVAWDEPATGDGTMSVPFGLATFARRSLPIERRDAPPIIEHEDYLDAVPGLHHIVRPVQRIRLRWPGRGALVVANFHGMARPNSKLDSPERRAQSRVLRQALAEEATPAVLIGDFNLLPDTESIHLLERDFRNLVVECAIPTTRSRLNPHYGLPTEQRHADYAFVSPSLEVRHFEVPDVSVSDHLPLLLEVSL